MWEGLAALVAPGGLVRAVEVEAAMLQPVGEEVPPQTVLGRLFLCSATGGPAWALFHCRSRCLLLVSFLVSLGLSDFSLALLVSHGGEGMCVFSLSVLVALSAH